MIFNHFYVSRSPPGPIDVGLASQCAGASTCLCARAIFADARSKTDAKEVGTA